MRAIVKLLRPTRNGNFDSQLRNTHSRQTSEKSARKIFWSGIIGNSLDHYDSALYAFLAPFMVSNFFTNSDPIIALILIYGIKSSGFLSRPLGTIFFGHLARFYCIKKLLSLTIFGTAIFTFLIALIPSYSIIGILAPILLVICRISLGFFAAGEHNIASLFILEQVADSKKLGRASSYYLFSTMMGTLLASIAAYLVSISPNPQIYWRLPFIFGIISAIVAIYLRWHITDYNISNKSYPKKYSSLIVLKNYRWKLLKIMPISGFTFMTYSIPFIFLNNIAPEITTVKLQDLLLYSTLLVCFNNMLIPICSLLIDRFNINYWMASLSGIFCLGIIPIFIAMPNFGLLGINLTKIFVIIIGVGFSSALNAFLYSLVPGREKYIVTGFGYSLGIEIFGRSTTAICLSLWYYGQSMIYPAIYLFFISLLATLSLLSEASNQYKCKLSSSDPKLSKES